MKKVLHASLGEENPVAREEKARPRMASESDSWVRRRIVID